MPHGIGDSGVAWEYNSSNCIIKQGDEFHLSKITLLLLMQQQASAQGAQGVVLLA